MRSVNLRHQQVITQRDSAVLEVHIDVLDAFATGGPGHRITAHQGG